jgi:hypothetical protein
MPALESVGTGDLMMEEGAGFIKRYTVGEHYVSLIRDSERFNSFSVFINKSGVD